jgi:hypothetical protein
MANTAASRAAAYAAPLAQPGRALSQIQRLILIENALFMALQSLRQPEDTPRQQAANLRAATARTNRALTLLKTASACVASDGRA